MRIEKRFDVGDITVWLSKEFDENGVLICQEGEYRNNKFGYTEKGYHKILKTPDINFDDGEMLCHVTSKDRLDDILQNGLVPDVGEIYADYWKRSSKSSEIESELQSGIFLKRKRKVFSASFKHPVRLYINAVHLDKNCIYTDYAWPNGESIFYTKPIPPEAILLK